MPKQLVKKIRQRTKQPNEKEGPDGYELQDKKLFQELYTTLKESLQEGDKITIIDREVYRDQA